MQHRIVWFRELAEGRPVVGGERPEDSLVAWDLAEVFRLEFGVNLEAFVAVFDALDEVSVEDLCRPERALEVVSAERVAALRPETFKIKDRHGMPREIKGAEVADWLEAYRELWAQGFSVVRTASE